MKFTRAFAHILDIMQYYINFLVHTCVLMEICITFVKIFFLRRFYDS